MAAGYTFRCSSCDLSILAWDSGDPYVINADGSKRHVYHPDPEREHAVGIDEAHLCLACGAEVMVDSRSPRTDCASCHSERIVSTMDLAGAPCPRCADGAFGEGTMSAIS